MKSFKLQRKDVEAKSKLGRKGINVIHRCEREKELKENIPLMQI